MALLYCVVAWYWNLAESGVTWTLVGGGGVEWRGIVKLTRIDQALQRKEGVD